MSKRATFSRDEMEFLRTYARSLLKENGGSLTTITLGKVINLAQQGASEFVKAGATRQIGRPAANLLAIHAGYRDSETLLAVLRGVAAAEGADVGNVWSERDAAATVAAAMGYDARAIEAVRARHAKDPQSAKRSRKWWFEQYAQEERWMNDNEGKGRP